MTEKARDTEDERPGAPDDEAADPSDSEGRRKKGDGLNRGLGVLSAFKDAIEDTINEARERGDLSTEKAREVMKEALDKAQAAGERARDRLDFATQAEVAELRARVERLEEKLSGGSKAAPAGDGEAEGEASDAGA